MTDRVPLVSFVMGTYGRAAKAPHVINECLYWITRQTYPSWEVIIVNDAVNQTVVCNHPRVRVWNVPDRYPTLGDKENAMLELANGDIVLPMADDDISLPWRAEQAVRILGDDYEYWAPNLWLYAPKTQEPVVDGRGCTHGASAFRRESLKGMYPSLTKAEDQIVYARAQSKLKCSHHRITPREASYVYRWGVSDCHLSAYSDMDGMYERQDPGPSGVYTVEPVRGEADWVNVLWRACRAKPDPRNPS